MAVAANQRLTYNSNGSIQSQNLLLSTEKKNICFYQPKNYMVIIDGRTQHEHHKTNK